MPKKILLADDSITIQKVVELTFSDGDYEVTAVNNGAKAVQKLTEMRPDIILSDIIMPEKNGYEVCEYVKSHPEFRNIPVVLLTGTFEPFDPDRAEKAGCDAVVTKPFESQSLIHKVEELIAQAQATAVAPPSPPPAAAAETASPWMDEAPAAPTPEPPPFTTSAGAFPTPPIPEAYPSHTPDLFAAPPLPQATTEMAFEAPPEQPFGASPPVEDFSGETRAFPRLSLDELQRTVPVEPYVPEPSAPAQPSAWDEMPAASPFSDAPITGGEPGAFTSVPFTEVPPPVAEPAPLVDSPFAPAPAEAFSGETRAFPRMSYDDFQQTPPPAPEPEAAEVATPAAPETSPWSESESPFSAPTPFSSDAPFNESESPAFSGETRAFQKISFDDMQQMAASTPPPVPEAPTAPWGEPAAPPPQPEPQAFGGAVPASDNDVQQTASPAAEEPQTSPWDEPATPAAESVWGAPATPAAETPATDDFAASEPPPYQPPVEEAAPVPFADEPPAFHQPPMPEDLPFAASTTAEPEPAAPPMEEQAWAAPAAAAAAAAEPEEPVVPPPMLAPEVPGMPIAARQSELSEEQLDRIARRVVELMSEHVVRNIAWEVIPDLAEMVVKERIRQLEAEV